MKSVTRQALQADGNGREAKERGGPSTFINEEMLKARAIIDKAKIKTSEDAEKARYARNLGTISEEEQLILKKKSVCVIGCGGLGGYVIESLARLGVGHLTVMDCDVFDWSNLNRQILSNESNIGCSKAEEAKRRAELINSHITVNAIEGELTEENCQGIIKNHDVVVDAVDNVEARFILAKACRSEKIPLVHGAIAGWNGQVAVIRPQDRIIETIYENKDKGDEMETGNPSFTPAVTANIQAAESLKLLLDRKTALCGKMLMIDLLNHEYEIIDFGELL